MNIKLAMWSGFLVWSFPKKAFFHNVSTIPEGVVVSLLDVNKQTQI